jgi:hypothetical protein
MRDTGHYRGRARHCRMLAELATGEYLRGELKRLAREFEAEALRLEIETMLGGGAISEVGSEF